MILQNEGTWIRVSGMLECWECGYKSPKWLEVLLKFSGNVKLGSTILYVKKI